ncbi:MAG: YIP1 family protein [Anaerolineae bacterium]|nr:YIP1 family protein [Anaerolineae bacterium]MCI0608787.1 YIP1 family protein [Anaerolineae bacterium]
MTDITLDQRSARRLDFSRVRDVLLRPRQAFQGISSESRATWLTPMLVLSITAALVVFVGGYQKSRAAMMGEITLPPDWEFWTPEMQNNYMQAQQATQGPTFLYVFPLVGALAGLWVGWLLLAGLLHFGSTLLGGRGSMQSALNIVAWGSLPFALRDLLRIIFMLSTGHAIVSPGLSGFASSAGFLSQLLMRLDIFLIWNLILLVIGFGIAEGLSRGKAVTGVLTVILLVLLAQSGLGALLSGIGGTAVQRPFF